MIEGNTHADAYDHDATRIRFLVHESYRVICSPEADVAQNLDGALGRISLFPWDKDGKDEGGARDKGGTA